MNTNATKVQQASIYMELITALYREVLNLYIVTKKINTKEGKTIARTISAHFAVKA
jgi:hypothetical protein